MKQFKKAKVIILPTKNTSNIGFIGDNGLCFGNNLEYTSYCKPQNLYIISDDEIKESNYIKFHVKPINKKWIHQVTKQDLIDYPNINNEGYKVLASTDSSLKIESEIDAYYRNGVGGANSLPQPSKQFIEEYIEKYNKGNVISDVLVEYTCISKCIICGKTEYIWGCQDNKMPNEPKCETDFFTNLKVNSDNTITIKSIKDSWDREEVIELLNNFNEDVPSILKTSSDKILSTPTMNKWIEQNL